MTDERRETGDGRDVSPKEDAGWSGGEKVPGAPTRQENDAAIAFGRKFGLGCFTFFIGFFSGGMVAVLLGRIVAGLRKAPSCEGLPLCDWWVYVGVGGLIGAISLPILVLRRLSGKK